MLDFLFYSDLNPVLAVTLFLLTEETAFILGHALFFFTITEVWCGVIMAYTSCLCINLPQLSGRFGMEV